MKTKPTQFERKGGEKQGGVRWKDGGRGATGGGTAGMAKSDGKTAKRTLTEDRDGEDGGTDEAPSDYVDKGKGHTSSGAGSGVSGKGGKGIRREKGKGGRKGRTKRRDTVDDPDAATPQPWKRK